MSIIKNICAYFHPKPNGSQEIEKNITRQTKTVSRSGLDMKIFLSAVSIGVIQKAALQTFIRKGLTALNK